MNKRYRSGGRKNRFTQGGTVDWVNISRKTDLIDSHKPSLNVQMTIDLLDMAVFLFVVAILLVGLDAMFFDGSYLYTPICDFMYNIGR